MAKKMGGAERKRRNEVVVTLETVILVHCPHCKRSNAGGARAWGEVAACEFSNPAHRRKVLEAQTRMAGLSATERLFDLGVKCCSCGRAIVRKGS